MAQIEVALTDEQVAALEALAQKRGVSVSQLLQDEVAHLLCGEAVCDDSERRRRALAAAGRFRSRCGDLSTHHDDYLVAEPEP